MKQQKEQGSTHVAIIIVLIIAILGLLGFVFWQNFMNKDSNRTSNQTTKPSVSIPTVKLKVGQIDESFPAKLSWSYPEDWTMKTAGSGPKNTTDTTDQTITLTSPSKNYEVIYRVGVNGGLGGTCGSETSSTLQHLRRESMDNFSKGLFVEFIIDTYSTTDSQRKLEGYTYVSGIYSNDDRINTAREGDSFCKVYLGGVIKLSDTSDMTLLGATIRLKKIETTDQYGDTKAIQNQTTIKKAYDSKEYRDAVTILKSTQLKE